VRKYTITDECIYCGSCEPECPERAISDDLEAGAYAIDPARCTGCPEADPPPCLAACPVDAVALRPEPASRPLPDRLPRLRGILRASSGDARLLLADLGMRLAPAREVARAIRSACELELEDGRRVRLRCEEARLFAPVRHERGPWLAVARTALAEGIEPRRRYGFVELRGPALTAGERALVVGEIIEQAFLEEGGFREAPRTVPTLLRVRWVAADEPRSRSELESALEAHQISPLDL